MHKDSNYEQKWQSRIRCVRLLAWLKKAQFSEHGTSAPVAQTSVAGALDV